MANKCFVIHEEVINVFHENFKSPQYKNCLLILLISGLLVQWKVGRLEIIVSMIMHNIYTKLKNMQKNLVRQLL